MAKYLYGASVQGIQDFIFRTNELKDIVGGSALVQNVCSTLFEEFTFKQPCDMIVMAAGNIKCIFDDEEDCKKAVLKFPKKVMEYAPGITISQAVVEMESDFGTAVNELEKKLRAQRNRPAKSMSVGLMGIERSRKTGLPAVGIQKEKEKQKDKTQKKETEQDSVKIYVDEGTLEKRKGQDILDLCEKSFGYKPKKADVPFDIQDMISQNDWIAIIHADGNSLGEQVKERGNDKEKLKEFSAKLDDATKEAAQETYKKIEEKYYDKEKQSWGSKRIPMRPIVLSGDDMTMICRADIALDYATWFMQSFEEKTKEKGFPLTACAGIAYIKSSYPFYYGYNLAEALCSQAKTDAKSDKIKDKNNGTIPSCLMFHKVQSSFVEEYKEIVKKELSAGENIRFNFGPYYLKGQEQRWTVDKLKRTANMLLNTQDSKEGNAVKSTLRRWSTAIHNDRDAALQLKQRAETIIGNSDSDLKKLFMNMTEGEPRVNQKEKILHYYPTYDVLSLISVTNQKTEKGGRK